MAPDLLPFSRPESHATFQPHRWRSVLHSNGARKIRIFSTGFILTGLVYVAFFSAYGPLLRPLGLADPLLVDPKFAPSRPSPPFPPDVLTLEQIRDIVAPTRGFFSRDYSLGLGWNNVRYIYETALLQAELLNRTLVLPSFIYTRACEYDITVCANYATMVNKGDAIGSDEWREMPIEKQMGFRIPISVIVNITHLRSRQPVITASEYLRLHGQDPESESSSGVWPRQSYHTHPNVFETNKTKTPSLFVIENHWYAPTGIVRVDYIPEEMKKRGGLERHHGPDKYDGSAEHWPPLEPTELSTYLTETANGIGFPLDWYTAKYVLKNSHLIGDVNLDYDDVVDKVLNAHGWEVLYTFPAVVEMDLAKIVVGDLRQVAPRSSIRGFKDDYHDVDADVVVLAGETHINTKPGAMRFTEELGRHRYVGTVMHSLIQQQKVFDLAEVLSSRMRQRTGGRMWMGAHMRRGDFVRMGWGSTITPEDHIRQVEDRLGAGRAVLADLQSDIEGAKPDPEQAMLPPPQAGDPFFVATDERDPDALRKIAAAGAVFMSDLLTMEDRREFGWPLMITDLMALVEQQLLVRSNFFYGHGMSSFSGAIVNMRAGRGVDPRTMHLD
ncbi:hypothetical protein EDB92DRAFT_1979327 [Lactarius akahatsu]|uniref:O-fucosyltransferase family protein n=1 Tax=Lactarius akahatsu TaxID=416441 RepID=A0AAD4LHS0_9AGAM|nr:hypothetical protein EDB92DRAFT_1979327 [Lactarius akahatsu]